MQFRTTVKMARAVLVVAAKAQEPLPFLQTITFGMIGLASIITCVSDHPRGFEWCVNAPVSRLAGFSVNLTIPSNHEAHSMGIVFLFLFLLGTGLFANTDVTSREQFNRLMPGGLPHNLHYNADRASLELRADDKNCPMSSHGFFELNINAQGEVTRARDVSMSRSVHAL